MCIHIENHTHTYTETSLTMWSNLHSDLLANIFSFLSPQSLARAMSVCRNWQTAAEYTTPRQQHPAWLVALPTRCRSLSCYVHNPMEHTWHLLSLDFVQTPFRAIATIGGLILFKPATTTALHLAICNPFTSQFRYLPMLSIARTNPAVGLVQLICPTQFKVYVAGGMSSNGPGGGGASYEPTVEMYDSRDDTWTIIGSMPVEFAVRLTVWTPNESVYSNGVLYWMTSARAYSIMGYEIGTNKWRELSVPMGDRLEFASLMPRNGKLTLVGGEGSGGTVIWELGGDDNWLVVEQVGSELAGRFLGGKGSWGSTKCVGVEGALCLYRELGSEMLVWRKCVDDTCTNNKWEWCWIEGCSSVKGKLQQVPNYTIKGLLLHPNLSFLHLPCVNDQ